MSGFQKLAYFPLIFSMCNPCRWMSCTLLSAWCSITDSLLSIALGLSSPHSLRFTRPYFGCVCTLTPFQTPNTIFCTPFQTSNPIFCNPFQTPNRIICTPFQTPNQIFCAHFRPNVSVSEFHNRFAANTIPLFRLIRQNINPISDNTPRLCDPVHVSLSKSN